MTDVHGTLALIGLLAVVAGVVMSGRPEATRGNRLALVAAVVLAVVVLTGIALWLRGLRPAAGWLGWAHILLGVGALAHAFMALRPRPGGNKRTLIMTGVMALLALLIGHLA
ncbi:MAG TPA: hypothetical protein VK008_08030 [Sphingobacteriaceae bacterium]|nr:hypothetical protein [Sphingobacteriaceae bacterium]